MLLLRLLLLRLLLYAIVGGKYCPTVLSSNKELVLGVLVGLALCSFAGLRLEGLRVSRECCRNGRRDLSDGSGEGHVVWNSGFTLGPSTALGGCMEFGSQRDPGQDGSENRGVQGLG